MHVSLVQSHHHDCTWLKEKARCVQGSIVTLPGCLTCSINTYIYISLVLMTELKSTESSPEGWAAGGSRSKRLEADAPETVEAVRRAKVTAWKIEQGIIKARGSRGNGWSGQVS